MYILTKRRMRGLCSFRKKKKKRFKTTLMTSFILLLTSPVTNFSHFAFSRCIKDAFPKRSLLCVDPMLCSQNSRANCSTRFRAGEASHLAPSSSCALDVTLDFIMSLLLLTQSPLSPKEIKETEIEGHGSLKREGLGKNKCVGVHKKK